MKAPICKWYVETKGDVHSAHKVIAHFLEECDTFFSFNDDVLCADGRPHKLWEMPHNLLAKLWDSRNSLEVNIRVWRKRGGGKIEDFTADYARMRRRIPPAQIKAAAQ